MTESPETYDGQPVKARQQSVALYERDIEDVERIRRHFDLDSFSQAVRRAIRSTVADIDDSPKASAA